MDGHASVCPIHACPHVVINVRSRYSRFSFNITVHFQVTAEILKRFLEMEANFFLKLVWGIQGEQISSLVVHFEI